MSKEKLLEWIYAEKEFIQEKLEVLNNIKRPKKDELQEITEKITEYNLLSQIEKMTEKGEFDNE